MIDQILFREAMARLGAAVNLITTDGARGRHGIIASAVCSVTDNPPTVLVCVNRASAANEKLKANSVLCINVLASRHRGLSDCFSDRTMPVADRFAQVDDWTTLLTGSPVLPDASAAFDCRIANVSEVGTHSVFFCEVADTMIHPDKSALIYFDRGYHGISTLVDDAA